MRMGPGPSSEVIGGHVETAVYRKLFRNRDYRAFFWASLTSGLGDWIGLFAILALTEQMLGATRAGAFALSAIMVARVLPTLLLGPMAGVFVDRWDRKRTMIVTDIGRGIVMALLALAGDIWALIFATLVIEIMSTLFIPAKDALVPNIVPRSQLVQANQLSLLVGYGTLPIGAGLFAVFIGLSSALFDGVPWLAERPVAVPIWLNAGSFLVSAVFVAMIRSPRSARRIVRATDPDAPGAWEELKEGARFIASHPVVRSLVVGIMGAFVAAGVVVGVGKLYSTILNTGDEGFGILGFAVGAGLAAGIGSSGFLSRRVAKERLFAPGLVVAGGGLLVVAAMPSLALVLAAAFVMSFGAGVSFITGYTLLQEHTTDEVRGRTFASFNTGVRAALFTSLIVGPVLVGLIGVEQPNPVTGQYGYAIGGVRTTLMLGGAVGLVGAVWTWRSVSSVLARRDQLSLEIPIVGSRPKFGLFVAFEGGEGAGKSTQIRLLRAAIEREGHDALVTREPGGSEVGERLRTILLDPSARIDSRAETMLYAAARAQHVDEIVRPALEKGAVVLTDRFVDSSIVYQGVVRGLGDMQVEQLNMWGTGGLVPDLVVLLDIDAEEGLRRASTVGPDSADGEALPVDRLEAEGIEFHRKVNEAFRRRANLDPGRYLVIDASLPAEEIHKRVREAVMARLDHNGEDAAAGRRVDELSADGDSS